MFVLFAHMARHFGKCMRIYGFKEETIRPRKCPERAKARLIIEDARERFKAETVSDLRTTNIFLGLKLFYSSPIRFAAAVGLLFVRRSSDETLKVLF
jgi:hypothetical protein